MSDSLVRNIDKDTERLLTSRAAQNDRNRQAEPLAIFHDSLQRPDGLISLIRKNAEEVEGTELELPKRHTPRLIAIEV